jgi:predicted acylesterase/phospholipase RssA
MTLPGSASLGAFQAGAVAAFAVVVDELRRTGRRVHLDAVGGSSAGAIVAMLFTHCLLTGRDAPSLLRDAWVDEVDAELLRAGGAGAPLAFDDLRTKIEDFLADRRRHPERVHDPLDSGVTVQVSLTSLLGFDVPVDVAGTRTRTLDYADWVGYELEPGRGHRDLVEPAGTSLLDAVLASASHPGAFAPRTFDRSADRDRYTRRGIDVLPDDMRLWYTDGGLVESEPVGRIVRAARRRAGADPSTRLHVVVDPRSSGPSGDTEWADSSSERSWLDGVRRSLSILPTQALHDDIRAIASTNRRLEALDEAVDRLVPQPDDAERRTTVRDELARVADLEGKEHVDVQMITPLLLARDSDDGVSDLLAGDFVGAFGGFLDRRLRRNDYVLGWASTRAWTDGALERYGVDGDDRSAVLAALDDAIPADWEDARLTGDGAGQLDRTGRWQLLLLALQAGRVLAGEALPGR